MPTKVADFGPSPNSLDDNGNVSFESHSGSIAEPSGEFEEQTKTILKGSGQPEIPGSSQAEQFDNETKDQLSLNQLLEFDDASTGIQQRHLGHPTQQQEGQVFNKYPSSSNQPQAVVQEQNDFTNKSGTRGPRSDVASNHQKKPSKSVVKYISALPPSGLKIKDGLSFSIQTPRVKLATVTSKKTLERVQSASSQTRQLSSASKPNHNSDRIKIDEGQSQQQNNTLITAPKVDEEKAVFNLLTSRSKQSASINTHPTIDLNNLQTPSSIKPQGSFLQRSKQQQQTGETASVQKADKEQAPTTNKTTLKASELQQQLQALGSPPRYSPSVKQTKVSRNKSNASGKSKQASQRTTPNQSSILNRKTSPFQKQQTLPFTDRQAQKVFVQLQLPNLWRTNANNQTYSKIEMCEVALRVSQLVGEYESMLQYERQKVADIRNERDEIASQMEQQLKAHLQNSSPYNTQTLESALRVQSECLRRCYDALRDSMLHNFTFLEFYKDLQSYVSDNFFQEDDSTANRHIHFINNLMHEEHALQNMQINTETLENLRESVESSLKQESSLLSAKVQSLHNSVESHAPIKIVDFNPSPNQHAHNRHINCCSNSRALPADSIVLANMFKSEIQAQKIQIIKLKEDRENLRRKNIELKQKLQNFGDKNYHKHQEFLIKLEIEKHQAEINEINQRQRQAELELTIFKDEKLSLRKQNQQLKETITVLQQQKDEFEKLLHQKDDFKALENTVAELTSLVISKHVKELSVQQKTTLKTIFGDSSILHTLKQSLTESETENLTLKSLISQFFTSSQTMEKLVRTWWPNYAKIIKFATEEQITSQNEVQSMFDQIGVTIHEVSVMDQQLQNELTVLKFLKETVQTLNIQEVSLQDAAQTVSDMTIILSTMKSKSGLKQNATFSNSKSDTKFNQAFNNTAFPVFQITKKEPITSLKSTQLQSQLSRFKSSASLSPSNREESRQNKLLNCKSAEMFETTPAIMKQKLKQTGAQDQKLQNDLKQELNQSIQSLIESVVMPELPTYEKNLDELDSSLLDFVKGESQKVGNDSKCSSNAPILITGIFKEADCDLDLMKPRGRKRRPAGKSQNQTTRRTHASGDIQNRQNDYLRQQLKLKNKELSSQEFDLLND